MSRSIVKNVVTIGLAGFASHRNVEALKMFKKNLINEFGKAAIKIAVGKKTTPKKQNVVGENTF